MSSGAHITVRSYIVVFLILLGLTALTTGVAFIDLGAGLNNVAALVIAVLKALLVILYFMHVRTSDRFTWVIAGAGFFWLLILMGGTIDDLVTRNLLPGEMQMTP
ncbi:MAG TPA: cytochrome C oxidase subunit IV family protein [Verrucomicrobiae bacterium]|jgi:cytochrome c oxidase subunit IV|nr:cytochrome C oxidase subunit IV family protein [Verrucomicrobiae bacterium]